VSSTPLTPKTLSCTSLTGRARHRSHPGAGRGVRAVRDEHQSRTRIQALEGFQARLFKQIPPHALMLHAPAPRPVRIEKTGIWRPAGNPRVGHRTGTPRPTTPTVSSSPRMARSARNTGHPGGGADSLPSSHARPNRQGHRQLWGRPGIHTGWCEALAVHPVLCERRRRACRRTALSGSADDGPAT
jgi:hypothetical protein